MANCHEMLSPRPRRTSYLASGVSDTAAGLVGLGCDLAGDVATSFLDGFRASVFGRSSCAALAQATNTLHARHGHKEVLQGTPATL